jgi:hypothetical protein
MEGKITAPVVHSAHLKAVSPSTLVFLAFVITWCLGALTVAAGFWLGTMVRPQSERFDVKTERRTVVIPVQDVKTERRTVTVPVPDVSIDRQPVAVPVPEVSVKRYAVEMPVHTVPEVVRVPVPVKPKPKAGDDPLPPPEDLKGSD